MGLFQSPGRGLSWKLLLAAALPAHKSVASEGTKSSHWQRSSLKKDEGTDGGNKGKKSKLDQGSVSDLRAGVCQEDQCGRVILVP